METVASFTLKYLFFIIPAIAFVSAYATDLWRIRSKKKCLSFSSCSSEDLATDMTHRPDNQALIQQVGKILKEAADPLTAECDRSIAKFFDDNGGLEQSTKETDNVLLLKHGWRTLEESITPSYIIRMIRGGKEKELLKVALDTMSAKALYTTAVRK